MSPQEPPQQTGPPRPAHTVARPEMPPQPVQTAAVRPVIGYGGNGRRGGPTSR